MLTRLALILVVAAAAAGVVYFTGERGGEEQQPRRRATAVGVEAAKAERRDLAETRVFIGTLEAEKRFDAAFKVGGRIEEIAVNLGDCVGKGDLIARLDSEEFEQQLLQAEAELEVARASLVEASNTLIAAERNYERATKLREQKVSSEAELEASETEMLTKQAGVTLARAQIKQREAALRAAEVRLSYTTLRADWQNSGAGVCRYVASRHVDAGDTISANTRVVTLVDLSTMKAVINVAERDYAFLQIGQAADISVDAAPGRTFAGTVMRLAPVFDDSSRQARVEIAVPNRDSILKSGMFARVKIELGRTEQTVAVPADAVIQRIEVDGAFVVENGTARFVEIRPGIEQDGWVQVSGIEAGQQVVTLGHHLLSDGMPVTITAADQSGPPRADP